MVNTNAAYSIEFIRVLLDRIEEIDSEVIKNF